MDVIMDGLMIAGASFAGVYCWVLSGRVRALKSLDSGLGGAIVQLTRQIELARATLEEARAAGKETKHELAQLTARADAAAAQLRLLIAAAERGGPAPAAGTPLAAPLVQPAPVAAAPAARPAPGFTPVRAGAAPPAPAAPGPAGILVARRSEASPEPRPAPAAEAPAAGDPAGPALPKPRRTLSFDGLLRRRPAPEDGAAAPAPASEAELIAALNALAAGAER